MYLFLIHFDNIYVLYYYQNKHYLIHNNQTHKMYQLIHHSNKH